MNNDVKFNQLYELYQNNHNEKSLNKKQEKLLEFLLSENKEKEKDFKESIIDNYCDTKAGLSFGCCYLHKIIPNIEFDENSNMKINNNELYITWLYIESQNNLISKLKLYSSTNQEKTKEQYESLIAYIKNNSSNFILDDLINELQIKK